MIITIIFAAQLTTVEKDNYLHSHIGAIDAGILQDVCTDGVQTEV
jgi:hypothetical protein